jgi:hypothetical protein
MRSLFFVALVVASPAFASGPFTGLDLSEYCRGQRELDGGYQVVCTEAHNASAVRKARVGANTKLPKKLSLPGVIELGLLPDADSSPMYFYVRRLEDSNERLAGYLTVEGWHNDEMGVKLQLTARWNARGQLVSAKVK